MFKETPRVDKRGARKSLVLGVGINDAPYRTSIKLEGLIYTCPYYVRWLAMMTRCYSPRWLEKHPTYEKCSVVPEWHSFMQFRKWVETQNWKDRQLDKDLLSLGSGVYSPNTCLFVTPQINSLFGKGVPNSTGLPVGVFFRKGKYEVGISMGNSRRTWVGSYNTIPEAIDAYIDAKAKVANKIIRQTGDMKIRKAIAGYLKYFTDKLNCLKAGY